MPLQRDRRSRALPRRPDSFHRFSSFSLPRSRGRAGWGLRRVDLPARSGARSMGPGHHRPRRSGPPARLETTVGLPRDASLAATRGPRAPRARLSHRQVPAHGGAAHAVRRQTAGCDASVGSRDRGDSDESLPAGILAFRLPPIQASRPRKHRLLEGRLAIARAPLRLSRILHRAHPQRSQPGALRPNRRRRTSSHPAGNCG